MITLWLKQDVDQLNRDMIVYDRNDVHMYITKINENDFVVTCEVIGDEILLIADGVKENDRALDNIFVSLEPMYPPRSLKDLADTMRHFYLTGE